MAQSTLDLILRTKKTGDAVESSNKSLQNLKKSSNDLARELTGLTLGVGTVAAGLKWVIGEAGESEMATARLEAVLKATGGTAGMTSDELNNLAGSLSNLSSVDDEAIVNAEAVMLTYNKIGKDTFPQAMQAALDLSAVLGTDLQSAVQMIGKALDNPAEGLTALTRAAGKFTDEETKMIQGLVEAGQLEEAQAAILDKLEGKYGGAAEAMGNTMVGSVNRLKNALNNLAESVGTRVAPAITWLAENAATALDASAEVQKVDTAWGDFFNTMIKEGKSAEEIMAAYNEKVRLVNAEWNKGQTGADHLTRSIIKLTTEEEKFLRDQEGLQQALMLSATSADEYAMSILNISDAQALASTNPFTRMLVDAAKAEYNAANAGQKLAGTYTDILLYEKGMEDAAYAQLTFAHTAQDVALSMDEVQFAIAGAVSGAWTDYESTMADLTTEHDELTAKVKQLTDWGYSPLGRTIGEVNTELEINEGKQRDAAAAVQEATNQMIFQQAAAGLDATATLELAKAMGMISDEDYAISQTLANLKYMLDTGAISSEEYAKQVAAIADAVNALHDKEIEVTVTTINQTVNAGVVPENYQRNQKRQTGGQWTVAGPTGLDTVPVSFWATAGETVTVTPAGATPPGGGGGNVTISPGAIVVNAAPGMDEARLVDEMMRRLSQETKRRQKAGEVYLANG